MSEAENIKTVLEVVLAGTIVGVADTATLSATVLINGAETDSVPLQWTSSDSAIAVVDSTGMVRGRARGTAVISPTPWRGVTWTPTETSTSP